MRWKVLSNCEWKDCKAACGGALFVHDNTDAVLEVINSSFVRCNATSTLGGAIYALNIAVCSVNDSSFQGCYCVSSRDWGGAGIHCHSSGNGDGGGLCICEMIGGIILHNCRFENGYSGRSSNNRVARRSDGQDLSNYLSCEYDPIRYVASFIIQPNAKDTYSCGFSMEHPCESISFCVSQLIPGVVANIYMMDGSIPEAQPIKILNNQYILSGPTESGAEIQTMFAESDVSLFTVSTGSLDVNHIRVIHDSSINNNRESRICCISSSGAINLKNTNISTDNSHSPDTSFKTEMIRIVSGSLTMESVEWTHFFSSTSFIHLAQTEILSISLLETTFENIIRTSQGAALIDSSTTTANIALKKCFIDGCGSQSSVDGGAIHISLNSPCHLKIEEGTIQNCYASSSVGRGGGVFLKLCNLQVEFSVFTLFNNNIAKWGYDLFVQSPDLQATSTSGQILLKIPWNSTFSTIRGLDNEATSVPIPLCVYLLEQPQNITVAKNDALNHPLCGFEQFPCSSLNYALTRQSGDKFVVFNDMVTLSEDITIEQNKYIIQGACESCGLDVTDEMNENSYSLISISSITRLTTLKFALQAELPFHQLFMKSSSPLLEIISCSISAKDPDSIMTFSFLEIDAGLLNVSFFKSTSLLFGSNPLFVFNGQNSVCSFSSVHIEKVSSRLSSHIFSVSRKVTFRLMNSMLSASTDSQDNKDLSLGAIFANAPFLIELTNNTITGFEKKNSKGGSIMCTLEEGGKLEIIGGTISECKSLNGDGGGLWIAMSGASSFFIGNASSLSSKHCVNTDSEQLLTSIVKCVATATTVTNAGCGGGIFLQVGSNASSFVLNELLFDQCQGTKGKDLFLVADDLSQVVSVDSISSNPDLNDFTRLNGYERSTSNNAFTIPLVLYLWDNYSSVIYVGGIGAWDFSSCGSETYPCSSILAALKQRFANITKNLILHPSFCIQEELFFSQKEYTIGSMEDSIACPITDTTINKRNALITSQKSTSFEGITFLLPQNLISHSLIFLCLSDSLSLNRCAIQLKEEYISFVFGSVEGGKLLISEFQFRHGTVNTGAVFSANGSNGDASIQMSFCYFESLKISTGNLISVVNGNEINITECNFSTISRVKGMGGCLHFVSSDSVESELRSTKVSKCNFDKCNVEEKDAGGGGMFCSIDEHSSVFISECQFSNCIAPNGDQTSGYGGGIYFNLVSSNSCFCISAPLFPPQSPNKAKYGNDVFIKAVDLPRSITNETLPFVANMMETLTKESLEGCDGEDEEYIIPLVIYWMQIGSLAFVSSNGADMKACGFDIYPCHSFDYSLQRIAGKENKSLSIFDEAILNCEVILNATKVASVGEDVSHLVCERALDGNTHNVISVDAHSSIKSVNIEFPNAFSNEAIAFISLKEDMSHLTIEECEFVQLEADSTSLHFELFVVKKGWLTLYQTSFTAISSSVPLFDFSPSAFVEIQNANIEDVKLSSKSAFILSDEVENDHSNFVGEENCNICFSSCKFLRIHQNFSDNPSAIQAGKRRNNGIIIVNSTFQDCGSTVSQKGGCMLLELHENFKIVCANSTIVECFVSYSGRGGGMFLIGKTDDNHPLQFVFSNITLSGNRAYRGFDFFIKCQNIETQIDEGQFQLDFRRISSKELSIWGCTRESYEDEQDLLPRVILFRSETIFVSSVSSNNTNNRQCGSLSGPCTSLDAGISHIIPTKYSQLLIVEETNLQSATSIISVLIRTLDHPKKAIIHFINTIECENNSLITSYDKVKLEYLSFIFNPSFCSDTKALIGQMNGTLTISFLLFSVEPNDSIHVKNDLSFNIISVDCGSLLLESCEFSFLRLARPMILISPNAKARIEDSLVHDIASQKSLLAFKNSLVVTVRNLNVSRIQLQEGTCCEFALSNDSKAILSCLFFENITTSSDVASSIMVNDNEAPELSMDNCSFRDCISHLEKGSIASFSLCKNVTVSYCSFEGPNSVVDSSIQNTKSDAICKWNGSLVDFSSSDMYMKEAKIENSPKGGMSLSGGNATIEKGEFSGNNANIEGYSSARRNILCFNAQKLGLVDTKEGGIANDNKLQWIINDGCDLVGSGFEKGWGLFMPIFEDIKIEDFGEWTKLRFFGKMFHPCNLSFQVISSKGEENQIETYEFGEEGYLTEKEAEGIVGSNLIKEAEDEAEVLVRLKYGFKKSPLYTDCVVIKNRTGLRENTDSNILKGEAKTSSLWVVIVIILCILLLVLFVAIVFIVRWRKQKRRTEELEIIVEDTVKKEPKAFEMVTMEMSPEEQWRRAEREAEKKNDERMKKRIYDTNMQHSESSEHLLSESGSTEYILGRDSDKIPQWMLEKVEEEETRKRTPSPSISSTSTADSDSTFVRGEDLCPTTSSMSNLVDAMACSSPHEKLIVDLRDSLFMLLHGRNKTKEMPIGTLQEREQTAAQILFWVANGALHSFDEMENPLQSLSNLSPHIVLFSEHMVICIVMHSDLLSDDDSDSSPISSSTVVTSASDDDDDSLPSSAFEDEDDFKKECLRWKAPELLINKKMGATKESVSFSIGMMLWECLTLQIPFGDYEAEVAGQKIVNGERPSEVPIHESELGEIIKKCWKSQRSFRISLDDLKRELFLHFPAGAVILTMSDAIDQEDDTENEVNKTNDEAQFISESLETFSQNSSKRIKEKRKQLSYEKMKDAIEKNEKKQKEIIT
ncbi:uncharacterized protein MONOS_2292 [Monocercomonoides exilis]|uniref:uncharacterized protein n=1 Tax=Monocercomonoides exilis TaxID=2049356 RepID=UPI0035596717|nr:hypothetical protein MONOS_2292 [Monocercomonoides exilis]|eukprot:MONOS_2292.1-p1 / transcript=MONOS_2292.1 / gene=MONOS_2292 / organism=Monocercomonoides_exilis_PA203 / gene_product=unspecified product / transcript_product=unspecified product / location=Mono_scaffold00046:134294-142767(-) / protein_length=2680 / sequence_SO=supercontig / SO=protein_coding / is_pseudo=false